MCPAIREILLFVLLTAFRGCVATENDRDFKMCGMWTRSHELAILDYNLLPGCDSISISANGSTLSVEGRITAQCSIRSSQSFQMSLRPTPFCVLWDPLLDKLTVQMNGKNITLCGPHSLQESCCTDLSAQGQKHSTRYGIENATVHGDLLASKAIAQYQFKGDTINCKEQFCNKAAQKEGRGANMIEDAVMKSGMVGRVELPCAQSVVIEMKEDFTGYNVTLPAPRGVPPNIIPSVHLPASLKPGGPQRRKVFCSYYNNSIFQIKSKNILEDVVWISVENEMIRNLQEPVRITFLHSGLLETQTTKCVSWDTRRDPVVEWREDGCSTLHRSAEQTECHCNHLTYFALLVQVNPRTSRHLEALTFITAVGCAVSTVSCVVLFVSLCKQKRRGKDQSSLVHRGLVVALFFLCLLFMLTGIVANVSSERVCYFMGALLHYVLLSTLCWMAVEVLHTIRMVYMIFSVSPSPWIWYLVGFGFPVLPVIVLACVGNIYGLRMITDSDDIANTYRMCWILDTHAAQLAHYITNVGLLAAVISSGIIMLFLVVRVIHNRSEWRKNRVAFLSIWGLSCLFGTTWSLTFFDFGPLSEVVLFLFCIINSLQGFFLMLRFYVLARMQKQSEDGTDGTSTGSTRQHMLQCQDKI